ncbi:PAS domain-containing protein [Ochromonadaceae sp. CCMP2298]|nr:PAS domain-containing protein [Ochromonadaceae sp. CCMP2298]
MLLGGDWLRSLTAAVEDLPLCVTLASARVERRGFPLVYVNKAFEAATQYDRKDIVGKNCNFLQTSTTETEQITKMSDALRNAKPVKVALTNYRKNGEPFINLLAMKPVFDADGTYAYVLGVQYDITDRSASLLQMQMVDDLLSILPNVLK